MSLFIAGGYAYTKLKMGELRLRAVWSRHSHLAYYIWFPETFDTEEHIADHGTLLQFLHK